MDFRIDPRQRFQPAHDTVGSDPAGTAAPLAMAAAVDSTVHLDHCALEELQHPQYVAQTYPEFFDHLHIGGTVTA